MAQLLDIVEGWTAELGPFTLKADGVAVDLTGLDVELKLRPQTSSAYSVTTGNVRVDDDPTTGKVYFKPDVADFKASKSPYALHWQVTDPAGNVVFFPNGDADTIAVWKP